MGSRQVTYRVVVDTNVVVSALVFRAGRTSWMRSAWSSGSVAPVVSEPTITELLRVLAYPKFALTQEEIDELLAEYLPFAEVWTDEVPPSGVRVPDVDDTMFVDLAVAAKADMLVSGDTHLTGLVGDGTPQVVKPDGLRTLLGQ